jgi:hypothetical protein
MGLKFVQDNHSLSDTTDSARFAFSGTAAESTGQIGSLRQSRSAGCGGGYP